MTAPPPIAIILLMPAGRSFLIASTISVDGSPKAYFSRNAVPQGSPSGAIYLSYKNSLVSTKSPSPIFSVSIKSANESAKAIFVYVLNSFI